MVENKIIKHIKNNNLKGLDLLIDVYSTNIYHLVKSILKNCKNEEIEECISNIFIDIYDNIGLYNKEKTSFNRFILSRAKQNALDYELKLEKNNARSKDTNKHIFTIEDIKVEELIKDQENKEIINIIRSFKEPDKTYFYLKYFRGYEEETIAEIFDDSISGVQNILYRCRFKIKNILEKGAKVSG